MTKIEVRLRTSPTKTIVKGDCRLRLFDQHWCIMPGSLVDIYLHTESSPVHLDIADNFHVRVIEKE